MCRSIFRNVFNVTLNKRQKIFILIVVFFHFGLYITLQVPKITYLRPSYVWETVRHELLQPASFPLTKYGMYDSSQDFENFNNESGAPHGMLIVPNVVHFIRFGRHNMTFIEAVCVLAALKNQRPDKLVIHTDYVEQGGKYWDVVYNHPLALGVLEVKYRQMPTSIFGQELTKEWRPFHAGDVARLEILMETGGIFLDGDSYVVRNLDEFRKFEMTLGWQEGGGISNQVIIAHKHARFLKIWYDSYKNDYQKDVWFYNAGYKPTDMLKLKPHLIHRVKKFMAEYKPRWNIFPMIYLVSNKQWKKHYVIHLMIAHQYLIPMNHFRKLKYPVTFDEQNILNYGVGIRDMAMAVYPFPSITTKFSRKTKLWT